MSAALQPRPPHRTGAAALWLCVGAVLASVALRAVYLDQIWRVDLAEHPAFIAAEGVVGLMAQHILAGERPVFYYGQYYMGSMEAYVAAAMFQLFGASMVTLRAVPMLFALAWIPLAGLLAGRLFGRRAGYLAAAMAALPSPFVFLWGFEARGGHAEHVTLTLAALLVIVLLLEQVSRARVVALGFLVGFSLWVNQLAAAYVPLYAWAVWSWLRLRRVDVAMLAIVALIGASPLLYGNVAEPLCTARAVFAKARASYTFGSRHTRADDDSSPSEKQFYRSVPLLEVLGAQPKRDGKWSVAGTLNAIALLMGAAASIWPWRRQRPTTEAMRGAWLLAAVVGITVIVGIGGFSGQPVGRYQLLLYPVLGVLAAGGFDGLTPRLAVPLVAFIIITQAVGIVRPPPRDDRTPTRQVIEALRGQGLHYGYGADNMYDLVFESSEDIVIEPLEWSRYAPYQRAVATADRIFYLYRDDQETKVSYRVFRDFIERSNVAHRQLDIGKYHVLYDFTPRERLSDTAVQVLRDEIRGSKQRPRSVDSRDN